MHAHDHAAIEVGINSDCEPMHAGSAERREHEQSFARTLSLHGALRGTITDGWVT